MPTTRWTTKPVLRYENLLRRDRIAKPGSPRAGIGLVENASVVDLNTDRTGVEAFDLAPAAFASVPAQTIKALQLCDRAVAANDQMRRGLGILVFKPPY